MFETEIPFKVRVDAAERYYAYRHQSRLMSWIEILAEVESRPDFGLPETMVLLDPRHYEELQATDPRGNASFPSAGVSAKCRSIDVWGYSCPFIEARIHVDHMFPRSKGGATHSQNAMYLCDEHNMSKHTDIHLIRWESFVQDATWIQMGVQHLLNFAERLTDDKLYLPQQQLKKI